MIKFLRKLFLIDFVLSLLRSKQNPHLRFAGFLQVFSILWMILAVLLVLGAINSGVAAEPLLFVFWSIASVGFFFFYRHTSKILKSYTEEEAAQFSYLRYLNPVAPVIYFTTVFLLALAMINMLMLIFLLAGTLLFFMGILVTFGMLLLDDGYKLNDFISVPLSFFKAEEYFLEHIIRPEVIIIFLLLIYFIIPVGASSTILWQHHSRKKD